MMETETLQVGTEFSFTDGNVFIKATDTVVFCVHRTVLARASTYFTQVLNQPARMNGMLMLDLSENSLVFIQALLGAIYNIEG